MSSFNVASSDAIRCIVILACMFIVAATRVRRRSSLDTAVMYSDVRVAMILVLWLIGQMFSARMPVLTPLNVIPAVAVVLTWRRQVMIKDGAMVITLCKSSEKIAMCDVQRVVLGTGDADNEEVVGALVVQRRSGNGASYGPFEATRSAMMHLGPTLDMTVEAQDHVLAVARRQLIKHHVTVGLLVAMNVVDVVGHA